MNGPTVTSNGRPGTGLDQQKLVQSLLLVVVSVLVLGPVLVLIRTSLAPSEAMPFITDCL